MSSYSGPEITTEGLIFYFDAKNSRSWRGMPLTNQFAVPVPDGSDNVTFAVNGTGIFKRIRSGTYDGYTITPNDVVYRYDLGSDGCHYHGNAVTIPSGVYPTFTFDYYISPDATNYPSTNYLANIENYGGGAQSNGVTAPNNLKGVWQTVTFSGGLTSSSGTQAMFLYPGGCGGRLANSGYILYKNPQVIFSATNGMIAPFVGPGGVRSTTEALLDLTRNRTITCNSLTYAVDNTFSFNGSSDYLSMTNTTLGNGNLPWTVSAWVKTTTTTNTLGHGSVLSNSSGGPVYSMMGVNSGKIVYWTYQNSNWAQKLGVGKTVNDGNWHLLTWVNNSNYTMSMYVDGVLDSDVANSTSGNNNPVDIIGGSWAAKFPGSIASLSIYNVAFSANDVAKYFRSQRGIYGI